MTVIGELATWVALLMAAWAMTVSFAGGAQRRTELVKSGERAVYATCIFTALAAAGMWRALIGTSLFWCLVLTSVASVVLLADRGASRRVQPWMTGTVGVLSLGLLLAVCFGVDPYVRTPDAGGGGAALIAVSSGTAPLAIGTLLALAGMTLVLAPLLYEESPSLLPHHRPRMTEAAADPVDAAIQRARETQQVCEACGPRPEPDAVYCSTCGRYLPGACSACGTNVETSASSFCEHCGHQLAAA